MYVFEDVNTARSFTLNVPPAHENPVGHIQFMYNLIRVQNNFTGSYDVCEIRNGKPVPPQASHHFDVGDEVIVATGPEANDPPYTRGCKRGVVEKTNKDGKFFSSYQVKLNDGSVVPSHRDDPDSWCRATRTASSGNWSRKWRTGRSHTLT